jgi:hypothetical protein
MRLHAGWHGSSVQRHWMPPVALSIPHDPSRVVWAALSAIGKQQQRGGSGSGSASLTAPLSRSRATRSPSEPHGSTVLVACSDFGDLAAVVRARGGASCRSAQQGSHGARPRAVVAALRLCASVPHVWACLGRVSSPLAAVSAGSIVAIAHSSRGSGHVCVPGTGPYICRYARSWARVVNLGLCTSRTFVNLHPIRVASYGSAGKGLKARRAYIEARAVRLERSH